MSCLEATDNTYRKYTFLGLGVDVRGEQTEKRWGNVPHLFAY